MEPFRRAGRKGLHVKIKNAAGKYDTVSVGEVTIREARKLRDELQERADLEAQGVRGAPVPKDWFKKATLGDLCRWWLDEHSVKSQSHAENESALKVLVFDSSLCDVKLRDLTKGVLVDFFSAIEGYAPKSVNGFRDRLRAIINRAERHGRWVGANPARAVEALPVPKKLPDFLRAHEVPMVLAAAEGEWRDILAVAIYTAMRFGEILGLQKCDIDFGLGYITVRRSHQFNKTKGGAEGIVPIAPGLVPYLESAIARSGDSALLFPAADGGHKHRKTNGTRQLKSAMARAGLTLGYSHVCRKRGCSHQEAAPDATLRRCPEHGMKLWPRALARPMHFHQLRHTTASLLLMQGVPLAAVSKLLRHASVEITLSTYGHLTPAYLKGEIGVLDALIAPPQDLRGPGGGGVGDEGQSWALVGNGDTGSGDKSGDIGRFPANSTSGLVTNLESYRGVRRVEPTGIEPVASALRTRPTGLGMRGHASQTEGNADIGPKGRGQRKAFEGNSGRRSGDKSGDSLSPQKATGGCGETLHPPVSRYFTVKQAAAVLQVSTAAIYALVERGELPHRRVLNSIRIPAEALTGKWRLSGVVPGAVTVSGEPDEGGRR